MKKHLLIIFSFLLYTLCLQAQTVTVYEASTFVGNGTYASKDGQGKDASIKRPRGLAKDNLGNLYVAEAYGYVVRKISPAGTVTTIAGSGIEGYLDGTGSAAGFTPITDLCIDPSNNLYVLEGTAHRIRKITPLGVVTTFAIIPGNEWIELGSGICYSSGNLYVTTYTLNNIYKVDGSGKVTLFAGSGNSGSTDGPGLKASFNGPHGICADGTGNLYVADADNNKIRKIDVSGNVTTYAGSGQFNTIDGNGTSASFSRPVGIKMDANGNLYVIEVSSGKIRMITPGKDVTTVCGDSKGDRDGVGNDANFRFASEWGTQGVVFDAAGNMYIGDDGNNKIKKITIKTIPTPPTPNYLDLPSSVCLGSTLNQTPSVTGSEVKLNLDQKTVATNPIKDISKGVNGSFFVLYKGDSIVKYNSLGQRVMRFDENGVLSNIRKIAVDSKERVYAWSNGINTDAIHRIGNDGNVEFGGFSTPSYSFTSVTDMKVGMDGYLYVADDINGYIDKVTPADGYISHFATQTGVSSISFGKEEMYIFKASEQKAYKTGLSSANFTEGLQGIADLNLDFDEFEYDTSRLVGNESFFVSSSTKNKVYRFADYGNGYDINQSTVIDYTSMVAINQPLAISQISNSTSESVWVATGEDKLISLAIYSYKVSPALPEGLTFDILTGSIKGTPTTSVPATTYTIEIDSDLFGPQSYTINFSVDATGPINNSTGTATSKNDQADGLKINYFDKNNCAEMMAIEDEKGGSTIGNVEVKQEVLPTLASFASGSFVRRVTEVNAQNPDAEARIKLYFTKEDIDHYNSTNGPSDPDLSNDIIGGTMQVAVLQLHKNENGVTEQIKHNPITANWDAAKLLWVVDFEITKFSTFYMGTGSSIGDFDCSSTGPTTTITSCGYYVWRGKAYTETGIFKDTIANKFGCDSILTLDLTVKNNFEVIQDELFPEYLSCSTSGADSYQWINCDNGGIELEGETSETFMATYNGSYAVIATYNGCKDTSLCITVTGLESVLTGVNKVKVLASVSVYPNPGTGVYRIESVENYSITVRSALGEVLMEEKANGKIKDIDLSAFPSGIYHLTIQTETSGKTVKLIKN